MKQKSKLCSTGHGTGVVQARPLGWRQLRQRSATRMLPPLKQRREFYRQRGLWRGVLKEYAATGHLRNLARSAGGEGALGRLLRGLHTLGSLLEQGMAALGNLGAVRALATWWRGRKRVAVEKAEVKAAAKFARTWKGNPRVQSIRERIYKGEITMLGIPHHVQARASRDTVRKWAKAEIMAQRMAA